MRDASSTGAVHSEDRRFKAMVDGDVGELDLVLADDLRFIHANGVIENKSEFIEQIARGTRTYLGTRTIERDVVPQSGFTAIFGSMELEVGRPSGSLIMHVRYTAIYRGDDDKLFAWSSVKIN